MTILVILICINLDSSVSGTVEIISHTPLINFVVVNMGNILKVQPKLPCLSIILPLLFPIIYNLALTSPHLVQNRRRLFFFLTQILPLFMLFSRNIQSSQILPLFMVLPRNMHSFSLSQLIVFFLRLLFLSLHQWIIIKLVL